MKTRECKYLLRILENTFSNCEGGGGLKDTDCLAELHEAVEGLDALFNRMEQRLDQHKQLIVAMEARLERLEARR